MLVLYALTGFNIGALLVRFGFCGISYRKTIFIQVFYVITIWELQGILPVIVKMCFCDHAFGMIMGSSGVRMLWMFFWSRFDKGFG